MKRLLIGMGILAFCLACATDDLRSTHPPKRKQVVKKKKTPILKSKKTHTRRKTKSKLRPVLPFKAKLLPLTILHTQDRSVMARIPAGKYLVPAQPPEGGAMSDASSRLRLRSLSEFFIDLSEVSVEQFKKFVPEYDETPFTGGTECPRCPAMGIDWNQANRYCLWAGKRLPTEGEWEAAARGNTQRYYPWGKSFRPRTANLYGTEDGFAGPAPTGSFPLGASPHGVMDMIGNVWEWVAPAADSLALTPIKNSVAGEEAPLKKVYLLKGGSWSSPKHIGTISFRNPVDPSSSHATFGFRCAKSTSNQPGGRKKRLR